MLWRRRENLLILSIWRKNLCNKKIHACAKYKFTSNFYNPNKNLYFTCTGDFRLRSFIEKYKHFEKSWPKINLRRRSPNLKFRVRAWPLFCPQSKLCLLCEDSTARTCLAVVSAEYARFTFQTKWGSSANKNLKVGFPLAQINSKFYLLSNKSYIPVFATAVWYNSNQNC